MNKTFFDILEKQLKEMIGDEVGRVIKEQYEKPHKPEFLTRRDAAKKLKVTEVTLSKYTKEGKVKGYFLGGKMLYLESDLEAALSAVEPLKYRRG